MNGYELVVTTGYAGQTVVTGSRAFTPPLGAGDHWVQWTCGGWVAINPTVAADPSILSGVTQAPITLPQ